MAAASVRSMWFEFLLVTLIPLLIKGRLRFIVYTRPRCSYSLVLPMTLHGLLHGLGIQILKPLLLGEGCINYMYMHVLHSEV